MAFQPYEVVEVKQSLAPTITATADGQSLEEDDASLLPLQLATATIDNLMRKMVKERSISRMGLRLARGKDMEED